MIVVIGVPAWRTGALPAPAGRACSIALAAAARGARVELVGRVGEDAAGEALLIALSRAGVGHAAVLRDPARGTPMAAPAPTDADEDVSPLAEPAPAATAATAGAAPRLEPADVDLAVRYLEPTGVLVVTDDVPFDILEAAVGASAYAGTHLVALLSDSGPRPLPAGLPEDATVLVPPDDEDAWAFDAMVGAYAAAIDAGATPAAAFAAAQGAIGWELAAHD